MFLKPGDFLLFLDGASEANNAEMKNLLFDRQKPAPVKFKEWSLVFDVNGIGAWVRRRGFGCADNVEGLIVSTLDFDVYLLKLVEMTLGGSSWFSRALVGLKSLHPARAPQLLAADTQAIYKEARGGGAKSCDVTPVTCSEAEAEALR